MIPEDDVAGKDVVRYRTLHFSGVDREEVRVADLRRLGLHLLGEIAAGICEGDHGLSEFPLQEALRFAHLHVEEFVKGRGTLLAVFLHLLRKRMGRRVAAYRRAVRHHFLDHRRRKRLAAAIHIILVEVDREGVAEFLEDGIGIGVNGLPAVIHRDHDRLGGDGLAPVLPCDEIRHRDHRDAELAYRFHLLAELRGADPHCRFHVLFREIMVSEHSHADPVVGDVKCDSWLRAGIRRCLLRPAGQASRGNGTSQGKELQEIHLRETLAGFPHHAIQRERLSVDAARLTGNFPQKCHPQACQAAP